MPDALTLSPEDRAILALESPTVAGHTCKVIGVGGAGLAVDGLRARVAERLARAPVCTCRLGGSEDVPAWIPDEQFDVSRHVVEAPVEAPLDEAGLRALVAHLFEQRLDRDAPLWRIDVAPLQRGGSALVWRIHHALADGTAAMRYARALLWDEEPNPVQPAASPADASQASAARETSAAHAADERRRRAHLAGFLRREYARGERHSPFDKPIGGRREVAFASVPLRTLHDAAKALDGATLNDVVVTVVAGAVGRWLREQHGHLGKLRVRIPVSLHEEGDATANRDSFFAVGVPLDQMDPVARLHAVHAATRERKLDDDARYHDELVRELEGVSPSLERFVERLERSPRRFALCVSNVPGPRPPLSVLGAPVERMHSLAEIGERHALRVAALSFAGSLCFGLCADAQAIDHLQAMADGIEAESRALLDGVRVV